MEFFEVEYYEYDTNYETDEEIGEMFDYWTEWDIWKN